MSVDSPEAERLRLAMDLFEFAEAVTMERLRREHPDAGPHEIEALFRQWLATRPGAEQGDGVGRPSSRFDGS